MMPERLSLYIRSRLLAVKRRWSLAARGDFDPYPPRPDGLSFSPSQWAQARGESMTGALDFSIIPDGGIKKWQKQARTKLRDLLRVRGAVSLPGKHSETVMSIASGYTRRRVYLRFAPGCDAPVDIIRRADQPPDSKAPVVICMQGTNSGAHLSLGEVRMPADVYKVDAGSALALQAADLGYTAISFERACFGERREGQDGRTPSSPTVDAAFHSLILGETLLGQTVSELEALRLWIDSEVASGAPVYLAGYSAAGTAAIAAAACCEDFAGVAVGGCVGMFCDTVLKRGSSGYNDIPDILNWFEFDALLALIAPRTCLIIAGEKDHIWPYSAGEKVMSSAVRAWELLGAEQQVELIAAPGGHTYYPDLMWPAFERMVAGEA